jgi:hypothetical protein
VRFSLKHPWSAMTQNSTLITGIATGSSHSNDFKVTSFYFKLTPSVYVQRNGDCIWIGNKHVLEVLLSVMQAIDPRSKFRRHAR